MHGVMANVTFLFGPPGAGKTTYARERMERGDVLVDLDAFYMALTGLPMYDRPQGLEPYACAARDAVVQRLARPGLVRQAWVTVSGATKAERDHWVRMVPRAKSVLLDVDADTCKGRVALDTRRTHQLAAWVERIDEWWRGHEEDRCA